MTNYILQRTIETALLLLVMSFVIYGLIGLMPGDPIDLMVSSDPNLTSEDAARLKALQGLDRPLLQRYASWLANAFQGELGYSRLYSKPVLEVLAPRLINTVLLMAISFAASLAIAFPLGIIAAVKKDSAFDRMVNLLAFASFSIPSFWLGLMMIIIFAVSLGLLPAGGVQTVGDGSFLDRVYYMILPVSTLVILNVGFFLRFIRASMVETLHEPFIRTARSKGLGPSAVIMRHALQHSMIPVMTVIALHFGTLFSGSLVVETIFGYLGMGKLIYNSIIGNDFNLALAGLMLATFVTLAANFMADLLYFKLDPRIEVNH